MGVVESAVAGLGQALVYIANHVVPHLFGGEIANQRTRNRLHVGCAPLFHPVMALLERREREVDHFVGEDPVAMKLVERGVPANGDAANRAMIAKAAAVGDALAALGLEDVNVRVSHGICAEIGGNGAGGFPHPVQQGGARQVEIAGLEADIDGAAADGEVIRGIRGLQQACSRERADQELEAGSAGGRVHTMDDGTSGIRRRSSKHTM